MEVMLSALDRFTKNISRMVRNVKLLLKPTSQLTGNPTGHQVDVTYDSDQNVGIGSWIVGRQTNVETKGTGTHDKVIVTESRAKINGGDINALVLYEAILEELGGDTNIGGLAGFLFPNLQDAHPDILNKVGTFASFANQDPRAIIYNAGRYANKNLVEVSPPNHPGIAPGRYYTAPYRWLGYDWTQLGRWDICPVYVPHRTTIRKLGMCLKTAHATAVGKIAMYAAIDGKIGTLMGQTAQLSMNTTGELEGDVNFVVDAGYHWLVVQTSAAVNIGYHSPQDTGSRTAEFGQSSGILSDGNTLRSAYVPAGIYGDFPSSAGIVPTYTNKDAEAHLWFRTL